jgi:hypothetical protein
MCHQREYDTKKGKAPCTQGSVMEASAASSKREYVRVARTQKEAREVHLGQDQGWW